METEQTTPEPTQPNEQAQLNKISNYKSIRVRTNTLKRLEAIRSYYKEDYKNYDSLLNDIISAIEQKIDGGETA